MIYQGAIEHDVLQNDALGGIAIWTFANGYFKSTGKTRGVPLPASMIVLPIVFHEASVAALSARNFDGGLYTALSEHRGLFAGLQDRMESMAGQSLSALNMAFAAALLHFDSESSGLVPMRSTEPKEVITENIARILSTSRRLGYWAAQIGAPQLFNLLGVRL